MGAFDSGFSGVDKKQDFQIKSQFGEEKQDIKFQDFSNFGDFGTKKNKNFDFSENNFSVKNSQIDLMAASIDVNIVGSKA